MKTNYFPGESEEKLPEMRDIMLDFCQMDQDIRHFTTALEFVNQQVHCQKYFVGKNEVLIMESRLGH